MKKITKSSILLAALMTASFGSGFYANNFLNNENNIEFISYDSKASIPENISGDAYMAINNVVFTENLGIVIKYTVQTKTGDPVTEQWLQDTIYGTKLVIAQQQIDGTNKVIEEHPFPITEISEDGVQTSSEVDLNNLLYEPGAPYDVYLAWHEVNSSSDIWYNSSAKTFTTPISRFPEYSWKVEKNGATQSLLSFNVDYDDSFAGIVPYDPSLFFKSLRFNWENDAGSNDSGELIGAMDEFDTNYQNIWMTWDEVNSMFSYYILIDNLSTTSHNASYTFQYNNDSFSTSEVITGDPLTFEAGNKYNDAPLLDASASTPENPTTMLDYQTVFVDVTVNANPVWEDLYYEVITSLDENNSFEFELDPTSCTTGVTIENIKNKETGEIVPYTSTPVQVNDYGMPLQTIKIDNLEPGTEYTADVVLGLNQEIFSQPEVRQPVYLKTINSIPTPLLAYESFNSLDNSVANNWNRAELVFSFYSPSVWNFSSDLIMPGEVFESGTITFYPKDDSGAIIEDGDEWVVGNITNDILSKLQEGNNTLNTNLLSGVELMSNTDYVFDLELTFTENAQGLFNKETFQINNREFSTKDFAPVPTFEANPGGFITYPDKTKLTVPFDINVSTEYLTSLEGEPLTLSNTFDKMYISEIRSVNEDGTTNDASSQVTTNIIENYELVDSTKGTNDITFNGLTPETTYEYTAVLKFDDNAITEGWIDPEYDLIKDVDGGKGLVVESEFNSSERYSSFIIETKISSVELNDTSPDNVHWEATIDARAPKGSDTSSGMMTPFADVEISYELYEGGGENSELVEKGNLLLEDDVDGISMSKSYVFEDLKPTTQYEVHFGVDYNKDIISNIDFSQSVILFQTGENPGMQSDNIIASWGHSDQPPESLGEQIESNINVETTNTYDDIGLWLQYNPNNIPGKDMQDGFKSIELIDPYGVVIDVEDELEITTEPNLFFSLNKNLRPGESLEGYKLKINNETTHGISNTEYIIPTSKTSLLSEANFRWDLSATPTQINGSVEIENFNNILNATISVTDIASGSVVWANELDPSSFIENDSGSKTYQIEMPEGWLVPSKEYSVMIQGNYISGVGDATGNPVYAFSNVAEIAGGDVITTPSRELATIDMSVKTIGRHNIDVAVEWSNNSTNSIAIENVEFNVYYNDAFGSSVVPTTSPIQTKVFDVNGFEGEGVITFDGLEDDVSFIIDGNVNWIDGNPHGSGFNKVIKTEPKNNNFNSTLNLEQTSETSIEFSYLYEDVNVLPNENEAAVTSIEYSLYNITDDPDNAIATTSIDPLDIVEGQEEVITIGEEYIEEYKEYEVREIVYFDTYSSWSTPTTPIYDYDDSNTVSIKLKYNTSILNSNIEFIDDTKMGITLTIDNPKEFNEPLENKKFTATLMSNGDWLKFIFENETYELMGGVEYTYEDLKPYKVEEDSIPDVKDVYYFEIYGVNVDVDDKVELTIKYEGDKSASSETIQTFESKIDPNSMEALNKYEATNYVYYEIDIDADEDIDLGTDIEFSIKNDTSVDNFGVVAYSEEQIQEDIDYGIIDEEVIEDSYWQYNSSNLYLKVKSTLVSNQEDWRDLQFLVGRYIIYTPSLRVTENSSYYLVNDFGMIPIPMTFEQILIRVIIIVIIIILIFLLLWILLYRFVKNHRREKWYDYALKRADGYYKMHRHNMDMYGWSHKYSEYESLKNMTLPQLREYAKKMYLPIPYKINKKELVEMLSLLNETELSRVNEFSEYEIDIPEKVRDELVEEFQIDKKENKWMKKRFAYTIDRAQRMQEDDYRKSLTDWFVDLYKIFDTAFIGFTDGILIAMRLKKKQVIVVELEDQEWDDHSEALEIEEGLIDVSDEANEEIEEAIEEVESNDEDDSTTDNEVEDFDFSTLTKKELTDWLDESGVEYPKNLTKGELVKIAHNYYYDIEDSTDEGGDADA